MSKEADYDVTVRISELRHTDQTIRRLRALADGYRARAERIDANRAWYIAKASEVPGLSASLDEAKWNAVHAAREERARIVARLRELASALRAEAETQGATVFGTVAAVQEKTIEGLISIIEKSEEP